MSIVNNSSVRQTLSAKGIAKATVTAAQLSTLHDILSKKLKTSGCFCGSFKINPKCKTKDMHYLTCSSSYFDEREAVSFNNDGFIGFAGWAGEENVKPILEGVLDWAAEISQSDQP